jgi:tellurite resistance protein TehA-like permease
MMEDHAGTMTGMMWGMGLLWLLLAVVLVLAAAALVKYLFFGGRGGRGG